MWQATATDCAEQAILRDGEVHASCCDSQDLPYLQKHSDFLGAAMSCTMWTHDALLQWLSMQGQQRASPETEAKAAEASRIAPN